MATGQSTAVIYARISRADRDDEGNLNTDGVDRQLDRLRTLAEQRDLHVVREIVENDTSASKGTRKGFTTMLDMIKAGEVQVVVAFGVDRLARRRLDLAQLLDHAARQGIDFVLLNGADIATSTPAGRLVASMLGAVATSETETMGLRLSEGYKQRAGRGTHVPRQRTFGYRKGNLDAHPQEAAIVEEVFTRIAAGDGISTIANDLNDRGVLTAKGNKWSRQSVRVIATNPRYAGVCEYRRVVRDDAGREIGRELLGTTEGQWDTIVSQDLYDDVQVILNDPKRARERATVKWLLSGIAKCAECGEALQSSTMTTGRRIYRCPAGAHVGRTADPLDQAVTELVLARLASSAVEVAGGMDPADPQTVLSSLEERRVQLGKMFAEGAIDAEAYAAASTPLAEAITAAKAEVAGMTYSEDPTVGMTGTEEEVRAAWDAADITRRRRVIERLFTIEVHKVGRGVKPKHPLQGVTVDAVA